MSDKYILIDLERTLGSGAVHFWKQSKFGYTKQHSGEGGPGKFPYAVAKGHVEEDLDRQTVMFSVMQLKHILRKYGEI